LSFLGTEDKKPQENGPFKRKSSKAAEPKQMQLFSWSSHNLVPVAAKGQPKFEPRGAGRTL